jgi:1-aminocyclopropane-1-carboxylate deaminase
MVSIENKVVQPDNVPTEKIELGDDASHGVEAYVMRADKIHPVISGNKWFKLKYYLKEASEAGHNVILTWGGAYSNHIIAAACAANLSGCSSIGIIRGERSTQLSHTLQAAEAYGMKLHFISREAFAEKHIDLNLRQLLTERYLEIPEGGAGEPGIRGSRELATQTDFTSYTHILCAVGTGTMCTGLLEETVEGQQLIAVHILKGMNDLTTGFNDFRKELAAARLLELKNYHFGGYAKKPEALITFMNAWYRQSGIPTDFVYTGKLFYAFQQLLRNGHFPSGSRILVVHSGGLQGNYSLPAGTLIF